LTLPNAIIVLSSGILDGATNANVATCYDVDLIYRAGEHLRQIIFDILDYVQPGSGQPLALDLQIYSIGENWKLGEAGLG